MNRYLADYHTHTVLCDGKNTVAEMAARAYDLGFRALGLSGHGYTDFDQSYCMSRDGTEKYLSDIAVQKEKYRGKMEILAGIEQDMYGGSCPYKTDYLIASCHYLKLANSFYPLDVSPSNMSELLDEQFGGSFDKLAESYYSNLASMPERLDADIIGHFDIITKYREIQGIECTERYYDAARRAADALLRWGKPFEINVGAITRGYRTSPYPDARVLTYLRERGAKILITGDCHSAATLGENLQAGVELAKACGFTERLVLTADGWLSIPI